jgi:energy-coupling factor transporter transmembrane protein EcfT
VDLSYLDYLSTCGRTPLHRAGPLSKVLLAAAFVASAVLARDTRAGLAGASLGVVVILVAGIPARVAAGLLAYPAVFGWAFSAGDPWLGCLRAVTAAGGVIAVLGTTRFSDVHSIVAACMPRLLADSIYLTYRSFFILSDEVARVSRAVRLKGARDLRALGAAAAAALLRSVDISERLYMVLIMRGYDETVRPAPRETTLSPCDAWPVLLGAAALCVSLML